MRYCLRLVDYILNIGNSRNIPPQPLGCDSDELLLLLVSRPSSLNKGDPWEFGDSETKTTSRRGDTSATHTCPRTKASYAFISIDGSATIAALSASLFQCSVGNQRARA